MPDDRDTHFLRFADLLFDDISRRYIAMFSLRVSGEDDKADLIAHEIREIIAQRAYDLAYHVIKDTSQTCEIYESHLLATTPDLTQWPDSSTE